MKKSICAVLAFIILIVNFISVPNFYAQSPTATGIEYTNHRLGFSLTLPASWAGKYSVWDNTMSVEFIHKHSMETSGASGLLFYVFLADEMTEGVLGGAGGRNLVAQTDSFYYVLAGPSGVEFSDESEAEYNEMYSHIGEIIGTVKIIPMTGIADPAYAAAAKIAEDEGMTDNYIYTFAKGTKDAAPGEPLLMVNGQLTGWPVVIRDSRALIPLSAAMEAFSTYIYWDGNGYISIDADAHGGEKTSIKMYIGQSQAVVNGDMTSIPTPPVIIDGQPYLPLRFLSEYFNQTVGYVPAGRLSKTTYFEEIHDRDAPKGIAFNPVIWVDCSEMTDNAKITDETMNWLKTEMSQTLELLTDNLDTAFYAHLASWGVTADDDAFIEIKNAIDNLYFIGNAGRYAMFQGPFITLVDMEAEIIYFYTFGHAYGNIVKADMNNPETFIPMYFAD
jgi:hypothetical protein